MYHIAMTSFHPVLFTCSLSEIFSEPPLVVSEHLKMKVCVFVKAGRYPFFRWSQLCWMKPIWRLSWPSRQARGWRSRGEVLSELSTAGYRAIFSNYHFSQSDLLLSLKVFPSKVWVAWLTRALVSSPHPHCLAG